MKKFKHCCKEIEELINNSHAFFRYDPIFRRYSIAREYNYSETIISTCPWCGKDFPKILEKEYYHYISKYPESAIPKAFITDKWWKDLDL
jgi:hypothetical protein